MPDELEATFCEAISRGWGVRGKCRACGVLNGLSDAGLAGRFLRHLDEPLSILRGRLQCGCGSKDLVLYPYQAGAMDWREPTPQTHEMPKIIAAREAELRRRLAAL